MMSDERIRVLAEEVMANADGLASNDNFTLKAWDRTIAFLYIVAMIRVLDDRGLLVAQPTGDDE